MLAEVDNVFKALGNPTRRAVVEQLARRPASVSELAEPFEMALPSFVQHLRILEECGLVRSHKRGRTRTYELEPTRIEHAMSWLEEQRSMWERRLDQLDDYLVRMKKEQP